MFVDEYLIEKAEDLSPEVYIRRLLGGFVMTYSEPEFGVCGFGSADTVESFVDSAFIQCTEIDQDEFYTLNLNSSFIPPGIPEMFQWLNDEDNCPLLDGERNLTGSGSSGGINSDSIVDGFSANLAQIGVCEIGSNEQAVYTSNTLDQKTTATVYYNNNVILYT